MQLFPHARLLDLHVDSCWSIVHATPGVPLYMQHMMFHIAHYTWCCAVHVTHDVALCKQHTSLATHSGDQALRELPSPGKSGSVFFLSHDDRFIIKTMRKVSRQALIFYTELNVPHHKLYIATDVHVMFHTRHVQLSRQWHSVCILE